MSVRANRTDMREVIPAQCEYFQDIVERLYSAERETVAADLVEYGASGQASPLIDDILVRVSVLRDADRILDRLPSDAELMARLKPVLAASVVEKRDYLGAPAVSSPGKVVPFPAKRRATKLMIR